VKKRGILEVKKVPVPDKIYNLEKSVIIILRFFFHRLKFVMSSSAIQLQWSAAPSSHSLVSIARGILVASTSDSVQVLAMLACMDFGNTIAMSQDTSERMRKRVLPTPKRAIVQFLQALVGYSKDDCATALSGSQGGLQFLGLASAILPTLGVFDGSKSVERMLRDSASATQGDLIPTRAHLQALLGSLETRCVLAGFMELVLDWQNKLREWFISQEENPESVQHSSFSPTPEGLAKLVDAFRQLCRIGEESVVKVSIRTTCYAPWVAAFTEWCLGMQASIFIDDGRRVHEEENSPVDITIFTGANREDDAPGFEIKVHHSIQGLDELIDSGIRGPIKGLAKIRHYGRWLLQTYEFDKGYASEAAKEALPTAIHQAF
jgi:hypothetical protein